MKITNRFTGATIYEDDCATIKETLEKAYLSGANLIGAYLRGANLRGAYLSRADLRDADLRGADLIGADLSGANLSRADLSGANLRGAYLSRADLRDADLRGADLIGADLSGANLSRADLSRADLRDADLRGANLIGADLSGADLSGADLSGFKSDFHSVLMFAPAEIATLRNKLVSGQVNGSVYEGDCACLIGTIANVRHCNYHDLGALKPDSSRPAEIWFTCIRVGDTPEKSNVTKITIEWLDEFVALASRFNRIAAPVTA